MVRSPPVGLALLLRARRDGGILRLNAVGRYGPSWWLRLSTATEPITVLSRTLRLSSNGGGVAGKRAVIADATAISSMPR